MADNNLEIVRGMYEAFATGDVPAVLQAMSDDIVWNEAEGFPYADRNPYLGPQAVVEGVFMRLGTEWEGWTLDIEDFVAGGDSVVAMGRYRAKYRANGRDLNAQFAHVWTLREGHAVSFQQYTDTAQAQAVVAE
jgi:ketosteroid isomerase-like protein